MAELTLFDGDTRLIYDKVSGAVHRETNADRIRAMTDEELAETLCSGICDYCNSHENGCEVLAWLKKEVE